MTHNPASGHSVEATADPADTGNTIAGLVLRTDGTHEDVDLQLDDGSSLHALYRAIGKGCDEVEAIDFPDLPGVATMWLDGEGMYRQPQRNDLAARLYASAVHCLPKDVMLVNDVVLTGGVDDEGNTVGLLPETRDFVLSTLGLQ